MIGQGDIKEVAMGKLNYATFIKILEKGKSADYTSYDLAEGIFASIYDTPGVNPKRRITKTGEKPNGFKDVPITQAEASNFKLQKVNIPKALVATANDSRVIRYAPDYFKDTIVPMLDPDSQFAMFTLLRQLIKDADNIYPEKEEELLGLSEPLNTDEQKAAFLAAVFLYAVKQPNKPEVNKQDVAEESNIVVNTKQGRTDAAHFHSLDISGHTKIEVNIEKDEEEKYNFDDELTAKYEELFGENSTREVQETNSDSGLSHILRKKREQYMINEFFLRQEEIDTSKTSSDQQVKSLIPIEKRKHSGRHFSIIDGAGEKTIVLEIYICIDSSSDSTYFELELLHTTEENVADNKYTKRTFYIDDPQEDGNEVLIFTFSKEKVLINNGMLWVDELMISKSPTVLDYHQLYKVDKNNLVKNSSLYDLSLLSNHQVMMLTGEDCDKKTVPCRMDSNIYVFDTVLQEPVKRRILYDEESHQWKAEIDIVPYRTYFAFKISDHGRTIKHPLPNIALGRYYREGSHGYQRDVEKALEYFEKDGSEKSLYEIAHIFLDSDETYDMDLALEYLKKSAEAGFGKALIELVSQELNLKKDIKPLLGLLYQINDESDPELLFFKACMKEIIDANFDVKETFCWLYSSASAGYKPAQYRISDVGKYKGWDRIVSRDSSYEYYCNSVKSNDGTLEFCLGAMLLFGWNIAEQTQLGIHYLEQAVTKGNVNAAHDLFRYFLECEDANERYQNLYKYGEIIYDITDDSDALIALSNDLFDIEPQGSIETDMLARKSLEKALIIDGNHSVALNNLAWSYKTGKGCDIDYDEAVELFKRAAEMGSPTSLYHLGDIYYKGLGREPDTNIAIDYWNKGAKEGNSKCIKALKELPVISK